MKITSSVDSQGSENTYPWLGIGGGSSMGRENRVILFTRQDTGTVLREGTGDRKIGYWSTNWDEGCYEPIKSITLTQE